MNTSVSAEKILKELDSFLHKNDYDSAEEYLLSRRKELSNDYKIQLLLSNELMGLYRKLGKRDFALSCVDSALKIIDENRLSQNIGAATTYLNCATVYKAFSMPDKSLPLFNKAREIYERDLNSDDSRLGGLYNNMGLTLVDLKRFDEANELYEKALSIANNTVGRDLDAAVTYLNMASAAEAQFGLENADSKINELLDQAKKLLENYSNRDGYYAFVCEKCASVFGYYGYFMYEKELHERSRRIYEGS